MTSALVDTSIVVDLLRDYQPAAAWLQQQAGLGIGRVVVLEILDGAGNKRDVVRSLRLLDQFDILPLMDDDVTWAVRQLATFCVSHNIDSMDALIAAVSFRTQLPLYTRNLKHFAPMLGSLVSAPY